MNQYIEVELTLDSFDLIQIENLISIRLKELQEFKANSDGWLHKQLADEQLTNYRATLKKVRKARAEVKRIKDEGDAIWADVRKAHAARKPAPRKAAANASKARQNAVIKRMTPSKNPAR